MGDIVQFRKAANRPLDPETPEDWRDEVTALHAETREMVEAVRPIVERLAVYGHTASPVVLAQARKLQRIIDRVERRTLGGAA